LIDIETMRAGEQTTIVHSPKCFETCINRDLLSISY
jgi:hypothetical protein